MDWKIILWCISFLIFWGYSIWYIASKGIPVSWSDTYYKLKEKYGKTMGCIFPLILSGTALPLIPIALEGGNNLMFPVLVAIMFIGAAPAFKDSKLEETVHMVGSYLAVGLGIIAFTVCYDLLVISLLLITIIAGLHFKWKPKNKITYIESLVILSGQLIILIKDIL